MAPAETSSDQFLTLAAPAQVEGPKVKGSRFIGEAYPVPDADAAELRIQAVRRREHAATHHVFAYRLSPTGDETRSSDDGEPSGTGGVPVLRQIEGRDLTDVVVIVTRYYGGIKLGTGGLARAYGAAAADVLDAARVRQVTVRVPVRIRFDYADTSPALHVVHQFDAEVADSVYQARTDLLLHVRRSQAEALAAAFVDALGGRGEVRVDSTHLT